MKKLSSEQRLYIESEDDESAADKDQRREEDESDSSDSSPPDSPQRTRPNSYTTSWPQSYRQSIDMYTTVASPNIGFLGTPNLSRLSSSYLTSSLQRMHTPEILVSLVKPLLPTRSEQQQEQDSHASIPAESTWLSSKKAIHEKDEAWTSHEMPVGRDCSYGQSVINGINVLCGVGILSTPYAVKEAGWLGLLVLLTFGILSYYTGILLRHCLDSEPGLETYPDIGQAAFGTFGRLAISIILYTELYACCVEYIILESDNLTSLFPNAHLSLGGFELDPHHLFAIMTCLAVLPTVWLRDLSLLSYISAGGVIASILVALCLFWVGLVDQAGFKHKGTALSLTNFPVAIGLFGYCYSGHAVFPNIYSSMKKPSQYPTVLLTSFVICTILYAGVAFMGYTMSGDATASQFTLNMPQNFVASKIAVWTTVVNPFTKFALTLSPVALSLEELIPSTHLKSHIYAIVIRTVLVISTLVVALSVPFFGLVMALIGSLLTMLVTLILPCACFLSILRGKITFVQGSLCSFIITVGIASSISGTYSAVSKIIESLG
ncbi:amino acid transporter AVT1C-like [Nymphaea colorata]|nr:amino acid transporter AVT1C-like [Nymphaea colorata]XP_049933332.1 amino acid transporter AVT1C-like [Nymphaea colorata]